MKNGYVKFGGGWANKVHYGRCASGHKRYVVQGMTHPSLSIVEKDNAVSISFVIIYRHTSSPLRYEGEEVT